MAASPAAEDLTADRAGGLRGVLMLATQWLSGPRAVTWCTMGLLGTSSMVVLYVLSTAWAGLGRDVRRLRQGIRALAGEADTSEVEEPEYQEFRECAQELTSLAKQFSKEQARLVDEASRDPLTGLPNRRSFVDTLAWEAAFAIRTGRPLSLIMVDLDRFKTLNDKYGHRAGDQVLIHASRRLASIVRHTDEVARIGGEEFAIILPGASLQKAMVIAKQLHNAIRCDEFTVGGRQLQVSASFGVAELHECDLFEPDLLLHYADMALYEAKGKGRDMVVAAAPAGDAGVKLGKDRPGDDSQDGVGGESSHGYKEQDQPIDRDTLALMGSTYSVLQVMPDRYRVAHDVIQQVAAILECRGASLLLHDEQGGCLAPVASLGVFEDRDTGEIPVSGSLNEWFCDWLAGASSSAHKAFEVLEFDAPSGEEGVAVVHVPLVAYDDVLGVIVATDLPDKARISSRQRTALQAVCAIGAIALKNCDIYIGLEKRWTESLKVLCSAIEAKDSYRHDHSTRVAAIAVEIAKTLGQRDRDELQFLQQAAVLHDIGILWVPKEILAKKRPLRDGERKVIEDHCRSSSTIVAGIVGMDRLAKVILHHHERYDGQGYPGGLSGDRIPLESRIIAVADAYDAMTSDRPYRAALAHEEAIEKILKASGAQFDPVVVDAVMACPAAIRAAKYQLERVDSEPAGEARKALTAS